MKCPACGGEATHSFDKVVLRRHTAQYFCCYVCNSLFVGNPTWLSEAYANPDYADSLDEGAAARNSVLVELALAMSEHTDGPWLDFGSGRGLFARGIAKAASNHVQGYDPYRDLRDPLPLDCAFFGAFEVLEHLTDPPSLFERIGEHLASQGVAAISTCLYQPGQHDQSWPYLAPEGGQHIFFPSRDGFRALCKQARLYWRSTVVWRAHRDLQVHIVTSNPARPLGKIPKAFDVAGYP